LHFDKFHLKRMNPLSIVKKIAAFMAASLIALSQSACAQRAAAPATTELRVDQRNVILVGDVVTMNAEGTVLRNGAVWVRDGVIAAVAASRADVIAQDAAAKNADVLDVGGVIYPGMIDLHNHPEYAIYPLLPITRKYKDRYEWRFYDEDYAKRITHFNTLMVQPFYWDLGIEVGRYGELKALVGGTTSLQGSRVAQPYAKEECLLRNIETSPVTARLGFTRVDIGRDAEEWKRMADERARGVLVVHLAEGVGPRMAQEYEFVKRSGLLGPEFIAVHGVGLTEAQFKDMATLGVKMVWSPLSNFMLYGETANIDAARRAGVSISLAPDWAPSGSKSILGELKVADLVNKHALKMPFTDRELVEMVTVKPAEAMGWQNRLGKIAPGYLADLIVVDRLNGANDAYRNLINATEEHIRIVLIRGEVHYGDQALVRRFRQFASEDRIQIGTRAKTINVNCAGTALPLTTLAEMNARLQQALDLDTDAFAKRVPIEQFTRDFLTCGIGKPNDPPTADDAKKLLSCRFGLPFETTLMSPFATQSDAQFFPRLNAIPHMPAYLRGLSSYYGK
jgi:5-methylthioadenosine/S-adenosylhomocysteine deaminase